MTRIDEMGARTTPPFLSVTAVTKSFGGAQALKGVSLSLAAGEVHGLVGANGAGKSTLIRILAGLNHPDSGEIALEGVPVEMATPHHATALGMSFIHQELALVSTMTVLENIMLGVPKKSRFGMVDWTAIAREVAPIARRVGITAPLNADVSRLSTAENWLVSICRALVGRARLIVMDEPTASLSAKEADKLLAIVTDLSAHGIAVLYVSHRLDEILRLCDRVTVFRDGRSVAQFGKRELNRRALVEAIVGGHVEALGEKRPAALRTGPLFEARNLRRYPRVRDASFVLHRGEVLGIGGLVGAGRSELARLIFGADPPDGGEMTFEGMAYRPRHPRDAVRAGVGFVPEERRAEGLILAKSLAFNLSLGNLERLIHSPIFPAISGRKRQTLALETIRALAVKAQGIETPVGRLSGGNQQKIVIGRWLARQPRLLLLDEPTRGVDVGARSEIHRLIRQLADRGMGVLVISSEPDELPDLCDRVLVMSEGRIVREIAGDAISRKAIVEASYALA